MVECGDDPRIAANRYTMQDLTPPPTPWDAPTSPEPPPNTTQATPPHRLSYAGRTATLFGIHYVNLALNLITLWIYRFWARTRVRRFLWAGARIDDEPFEYTGTGSEIFFGFLRVVAVLLAPLIVLQLVPLAFDEENEWIVFVTETLRLAAILYLIYAGTYFARRYRMSRTLWRGIRFHQAGSAWRYGALRLGHLMLVFLTLGVYFPWYQMAVARYETENLRFGTGKFAFDGRGRDLIGRFLGVSAIALLIALGAFFAVMMVGVFAGAYSPRLPNPAELSFNARAIVAATAATAMLFGTFYAAFLWYKAHVYRYTAERTRLETLGLAAPTLTGFRLARLILGNSLLVILSLGMLTPLAVQRTMRFWCRHLTLVGTVDLATIGQTERGPGIGEGLAGFFDLDLG